MYISMLSAVTIGAAASKKLKLPPLKSLLISSASGPSVSGPVAITVIPSVGISVTVSVLTVMLGCDLIFSVIMRENSSLSTASAPPAGTEHLSAVERQRELSLLISAFNSPAAESTRAALREFEQTSSANKSLLCAGVFLAGFISISSVLIPREAICHAASHPARPPPITVILFIGLISALFCCFFRS